MSKPLLALAAVLVFLLAACQSGATPGEERPAATPPTAAAPQTPTDPATTQPPTTRPPAETATAPAKIQPATLAPITAEPSTREPATPDPSRTETPLPLKPQLTLPAPASPTAESGQLPPLPGAPEPEEPSEWTEYVDADYGFTFRYPAERWTVLYQVDDPNGLALVYHEMAIALRMRFKRDGEAADLQLYGGADGDLTAQGTIRFLGKEVERTALVFQDVTTRVFYNQTSPIPRGDMLFSFALVSNRDTPATILLPEDVQAEADQILESFEMRAD